MHFSHSSGKDAHAPVFYLHLEPENCFAAAGVWHPDNRALTRIRTAIVDQPEQWAKVRRKLELDGDSLTRRHRTRLAQDLRSRWVLSSRYAKRENARALSGGTL